MKCPNCGAKLTIGDTVETSGNQWLCPACDNWSHKNKWIETPKLSTDKQVGGSHYSDFKIQPWNIIDTYSLDYYEGNAIKYILRSKDNRVEDLEKAIHYLEKCIELQKERNE